MSDKFRIAIQPDETLHRNNQRQSFSDQWISRASQMNHEPVVVDAYSQKDVQKILECDAFMWRASPSAYIRNHAIRLLRSMEEVAHIPCFFNRHMLRGFEDKVAQHYVLLAAGIPSAKTHVFWSRETAELYCRTADYPLVMKLANGYQSSNVILLENFKAALYYIDVMFGSGTISLAYKPASPFQQFLRRAKQSANLIRGRYPNAPNSEADLQHGYFYIQEFLPDNQFDIRITIIGNRAFCFRRHNRQNDFRASGSGKIDFDINAIEKKAILFAYEVAKKLNMPVVAVDLLKKNNEFIVCEYNVSFASWALKKCPGYWAINGDENSPFLTWIEGNFNPEDLIFEDFMATLEKRKTIPHKGHC